jgi:hypothetical protein
VEQIEHQPEPRLRTDEAALLEPREPLDRALRGGRQVVMRLVRVRRIVPAQPAARVVSPVGEILFRRARRHLVAEPFAQMMQPVVQARNRVLLAQRTHVRADEAPMQEADHDRRVLRRQQQPRRMVATKMDDPIVVHGRNLAPNLRSSNCPTHSTSGLVADLLSAINLLL